MKKKERVEVEYIYGKHAVCEMLQERPDVVVELYLEADFREKTILTLAERNNISIKILNLKNPPRGISSNATHQGWWPGYCPTN